MVMQLYGYFRSSAAFRASAERVLASFDPQAARAAIELYRGDFLSGLAATTSTVSA